MPRPAIMKMLSVSLLMLGLAACASAPKTDATLGGGNARPGTVQDFNINVGDRVFFDTDQTQLSAAARGTLQRQAAWLNKYRNVRILIEGHADERGTREYNLALGARRAANAKAFLVSQGVARSRIRTISYGKERPVATCDNISCWSQNRRAVTVVSGAAQS